MTRCRAGAGHITSSIVEIALTTHRTLAAHHAAVTTLHALFAAIRIDAENAADGARRCTNRASHDTADRSRSTITVFDAALCTADRSLSIGRAGESKRARDESGNE
ncbi:hypothetical protein GCM10007884_09910 [Methylobacterium brachythecii]|uniref:Uncharacterized protein n=1 Tax=Methylobacterium brachythecii TaxID=1176177 RepID=A0ABQ6CYZ3_9HYPH|nr:hypothetical protein GCM10007884_09910 [Methylobacterium brachythecii]